MYFLHGSAQSFVGECFVTLEDYLADLDALVLRDDEGHVDGILYDGVVGYSCFYIHVAEALVGEVLGDEE